MFYEVNNFDIDFELKKYLPLLLLSSYCFFNAGYNYRFNCGIWKIGDET